MTVVIYCTCILPAVRLVSQQLDVKIFNVHGHHYGVTINAPNVPDSSIRISTAEWERLQRVGKSWDPIMLATKRGRSVRAKISRPDAGHNDLVCNVDTSLYLRRGTKSGCISNVHSRTSSSVKVAGLLPRHPTAFSRLSETCIRVIAASTNGPASFCQSFEEWRPVA